MTGASYIRKQISTRTRFEVFKRDGFACQYCGAQPPEAVLHVDHILAVSNGGSNDTENLTTACQDCNLGKSNKPLTSIPKSLEDVAAEEGERISQFEAHAAMVRDARAASENAAWEVAEILKPGASSGWDHDKISGVRMFLKRLGHAATIEAAYIAYDAKRYESARFKYFCGVCWRQIREAEGQ